MNDEYFLHILPDKGGKSIQTHLEEFTKQKFNDEMIIKQINHSNLHGKLSDSYYCFSISACHLCYRTFNSFVSLICHYPLCHSELYEIYYSLYYNEHTEMTENHLLMYPNTTKQDIDDKRVFFMGKKNHLALIKKILDERNAENIPVSTVKKEKNRVMVDNTVNRVYFHSVTGRILNNNSDDEDYFVDKEELYNNMADRIDEHTDINDDEKMFLKLWNKYMLRDGEITRLTSNVDKKLIDFYETNKDYIKKNNLKTCFILHVINLYDYRKITSEEMKKVFKVLDN